LLTAWRCPFMSRSFPIKPTRTTCLLLLFVQCQLAFVQHPLGCVFSTLHFLLLCLASKTYSGVALPFVSTASENAIHQTKSLSLNQWKNHHEIIDCMDFRLQSPPAPRWNPMRWALDSVYYANKQSNRYDSTNGARRQGVPSSRPVQSQVRMAIEQVAFYRDKSRGRLETSTLIIRRHCLLRLPITQREDALAYNAT